MQSHAELARANLPMRGGPVAMLGGIRAEGGQTAIELSVERMRERVNELFFNAIKEQESISYVKRRFF